MHEKNQHSNKELCNHHTASCVKVERVWIMRETLWKNNLNFIKDVPMIHVNFIVIVIVVKIKVKFTRE